MRGSVASASSTALAGMRATVVSRSTIGAVGLEHVERPLRVEHDAGLGEHVERGLVDALDLVRREDPQRPPRPDVASVGVRGHESPFGMSLSVVVAGRSPPVNSLATNGEVTARTSAS